MLRCFYSDDWHFVLKKFNFYTRVCLSQHYFIVLNWLISMSFGILFILKFNFFSGLFAERRIYVHPMCCKWFHALNERVAKKSCDENIIMSAQKQLNRLSRSARRQCLLHKFLSAIKSMPRQSLPYRTPKPFLCTWMSE